MIQIRPNILAQPQIGYLEVVYRGLLIVMLSQLSIIATPPHQWIYAYWNLEAYCQEWMSN